MVNNDSNVGPPFLAALPRMFKPGDDSVLLRMGNSLADIHHFVRMCVNLPFFALPPVDSPLDPWSNHLTRWNGYALECL